MKLMSLTANKETFKPIRFKDGINLIVGKEQNTVNRDKRSTYNGVGKSLTVYIIHFCLGSNKISQFEEKLPDWKFTLTFKIEGQIHTSQRDTSRQNEIIFDGEKLKVSEFRNTMLKLVFDIDEKVSYLSFNTLFPRFIRRDRECYVSYDSYINKEQDYQRLLNNAYLLGLDIDFIVDKKEMRDEQVQIEDAKRKLQKDKILKRHFTDTDDIEIELVDLAVQIEKLDKELADYRVANNYHDIEKQANELAFKIKRLENQRSLVENNISQISNSLKIEPAISNQQILDLYARAQIEVPEMIKRQLEEVQEFHQALLSNRYKRLYEELKSHKKALNEIQEKLREEGSRLDENLKYLDTYGALDEFLSLNDKLNDLKNKKKKLEDYQRLLSEYESKILEIDKHYSEQNIQAEEYLTLIKSKREFLMNLFSKMCKEFYDRKSAGLTIRNNTGDNQLRFDITAKIQDDSSDGVNEVKIFCFDIILLILKQSKMRFLFHDSRLFGNMDYRQRCTLLQIADRLVKEYDVQYIASVNHDSLIPLKEIKDFDYRHIIEDNVILELTDESEQSKLLGFQIEMNVTE